MVFQVQVLKTQPIVDTNGETRLPALVVVGLVHVRYASALLENRAVPGRHPGSVGYCSDGWVRA